MIIDDLDLVLFRILSSNTLGITRDFADLGANNSYDSVVTH